MVKDTKRKIEFWVHKDQKQKLAELSEKTGYGLSELLRRAIDLLFEGYKND